MEAPKAPQLSAYDFLGYIVPGLSFLFLIDLSLQHHLFQSALTYQTLCARYGAISWANLVPLLLLAYFIGHLISFLSSVTVERHAGWMHGKPATVLLHEIADVVYLDTTSSSNRPASKLLRLAVFLFMLPVGFIEVVGGRWLGLSRNYIHPADNLIRIAFRRSMSRLLAEIGVTVSDLDSKHASAYEFERLAIHCALERAPAHVYSLRNYVVLFGFLRAMCFICILTFWSAAMHLIAGGSFTALAVLFLAAAPFTFTCYAGYLKFLFRYHYEAIMAIIATSPTSKHASH